MNKKSNNIIKNICIIVIFLFMCLYVCDQIGYISKINLNRTLYTEEEIRKFENKVLSGEEINIDDYFKDKEVDYDNYFSKLGVKISNGIYYITDKVIYYFNKILVYFI